MGQVFDFLALPHRVFTSSGNTSVGYGDTVLVVKKSSGAATTVTLPDAGAGKLFPGHTVTVKDGKGDAATNPVTVDGHGDDTIDGAANLVIAEAYGSATLTWNGTEWNVVARSVVSAALTTGAGAGITGGTGTVYESSVTEAGGVITTRILLDLTGLASSTTDLDIIGVGASAAHLGRITAAQNGTILAVRMTCLELPAGGADDIDLYAATEGTGVFDGAIGSLTETALITSGGAWASGTVKASTGVPAANQYLYLTGGEAGTAATYTAGKFLIELFGYRA